jgi:EmrB/QacA subfamily drug resistance transporter
MTVAQSASAKVDPRVWWTAGAVLVGALAVLFDTTIVAVGLDTLARELHASVATIQWVTTGYLLALGIAVPVTGWAQRSLGGKRLWIIALSVFLAGSVLSSLSWSAASLIAFRIVQGLGGGIMLPLMATLVMQAAHGRNLGKVMSVVSLPAVLGPILGPVVGGAILQHLHWSWMFWVNVPFCVIGIALAALILPEDQPLKRVPFDGLGFVLLAPGLAGLLWALSNSGEPGGFARVDVLLPLAAGVVLLVLFAAHALRTSEHVLVDIRLLRSWPLASASLLLFLSGIALYGAMILLPLYFQQVQGSSVLEAGLLLIPQGLGTLASRSVAGRLSDAMGPRWLVVIGFVIVALGTLPFAFVGVEVNQWLILFALFVRGAGLGVVTVPLMALGFRGLGQAQMPDASIITRIASQLGGAFGAGLLAVILTASSRGASTVGELALGFDHTFWWATALAALGALLSLSLPRRNPEEIE